MTIASTLKTVAKQVSVLSMAKVVVLWSVMVCPLEVEVVGMRPEGLPSISVGMHVPQTCQIWKAQTPKRNRLNTSRLATPVFGGSEPNRTGGGRTGTEPNRVTETLVRKLEISDSHLSYHLPQGGLSHLVVRNLHQAERSRRRITEERKVKEGRNK